MHGFYITNCIETDRMLEVHLAIAPFVLHVQCKTAIAPVNTVSEVQHIPQVCSRILRTDIHAYIPQKQFERT